MQTQEQWCDHKACPDFGKIGTRNLKVTRDAERREYCTTCSHTFHADRGTFFDTWRTDCQVMVTVGAMVVERHRLRAIGRIEHGQRATTFTGWIVLANRLLS